MALDVPSGTPNWVDTICRPLHMHRCGNSYKLEGGCFLSGLSSNTRNTSFHHKSEETLSIPKSLDETYETENLKSTWKIRSPCQTGCDSFTDIDLMFVIDGSASIKDDNFALMLDWIKNVSKGFDISEPVRIGVVQYSHWSPMDDLNNQRLIKTEIGLGQYRNETAFDNAVNNIKYQRSSTYTAHAINKTVLYDFKGSNNRYPEAGRVMILLTDGKSTDGELLPYSARFAAEEGVISYAVGVGHAFDPTELLLIAGTKSRVFEVAKFSALDNIVKGLQQSITQSLEGEPTNRTNELIHCEAGFSSVLTKASRNIHCTIKYTITNCGENV
uniref:vitrin-like n=1 Tax=Styela clava TaxID=7725 RepID=UPI00193A28DD|nr:vitrin-like [Styela clava]